MGHLYLDGLKIIFLILVRPNSAFETIRDNDEKYIWWSVGGFILSSTVPAFFIFSLMPPQRYGDDPPLFIIESALSLGTAFLVFTVFIWLIGWAKRGNRYWKKTFSVLFYAWIAVSLPASITAPLLYSSGLVIDKVEIELGLITVAVFYLFGLAIWLI